MKPEDRCIVEGAVYSAKTGEPLKKAQVQMMKVSANSPLQFGAVTDAAGHFIIENLEPGPYTLCRGRTGYVRDILRREGPRSGGDYAHLIKGQHLKDIALKLQVQGVITGRVVDEDGEPQAGVTIQASRFNYMDGKKTMMPNVAGGTDDRGEYRIYGVDAGKYYVVANFRENSRFMMPEVRNDKGEQTSYAPTYYPGALSISEASLVEVTPGSEIVGIDFRLIKTRSLKVSGKVQLPANGRPAGIMMAPNDDSNGPSWEQIMQTMTDPQGNFTLRGVRPGNYSLSANLWSEESPKSARMILHGRRFGRRGHSAGFRRKPGSHRFDSVGGWQALDESAPERLHPSGKGQFLHIGRRRWRSEGGRVFQIKNVSPERYRLQVWQLPEGHYIKSVRLGSQELPDDVLDFSKGAGGH